MSKPSKLTVLVVDDSTATRALVCASIAEAYTAETYEAATGFEALKLLPLHPFSLVVSDVNMPEINGLELVRMVRGNPRYTSVPVLLMSTDANDANREKWMRIGAAELLAKPFDPATLIEAIRRILPEGGHG